MGTTRRPLSISRPSWSSSATEAVIVEPFHATGGQLTRRRGAQRGERDASVAHQRGTGGEDGRVRRDEVHQRVHTLRVLLAHRVRERPVPGVDGDRGAEAAIRRSSCPCVTAITRRPWAEANWVKNVPTPPAAPMISRLSYSRRDAVSMMPSAVIPAVGAPAAIVSGTEEGARATLPASSTTTNSAYVPPPTGSLITWPYTPSPRVKRRAPGPLRSTAPAKSTPMTRGKVYGSAPSSMPSAIFQSSGLSPAALTRTRTSPLPGSGRGTSRTSGRPFFSVLRQHACALSLLPPWDQRQPLRLSTYAAPTGPAVRASPDRPPQHTDRRAGRRNHRPHSPVRPRRPHRRLLRRGGHPPLARRGRAPAGRTPADGAGTPPDGEGTSAGAVGRHPSPTTRSAASRAHRPARPRCAHRPRRRRRAV